MRYPDPEPEPEPEPAADTGVGDDFEVEDDASNPPTGFDAAIIIVAAGLRWACGKERIVSSSYQSERQDRRIPTDTIEARIGIHPCGWLVGSRKRHSQGHGQVMQTSANLQAQLPHLLVIAQAYSSRQIRRIHSTIYRSLALPVINVYACTQQNICMWLKM